jgi:peptidoglycan/LPS O-acetylase OafA/YrhL
MPEEIKPSHVRSAVAVSVIYFAGALYGLFLILAQGWEWYYLPGMLVSLTVAVWCLRLANKWKRRSAARESKD